MEIVRGTMDADVVGGRRRSLETGERDVLERIARGEALEAVLERIVDLVERVSAGAIGSILLLDRDGLHVRHGAAPRLPEALVRAFDGSRIGPHEGSCGAAAFLKQRVIVEDVATHPNWAVYKAMALPYGLRACWSTPILGAHGEVLGTFAVYYREPKLPSDADFEGLDVATHLASIAVERARTEEELTASERRYRSIYESVHDVVFRVSVEGGDRFRFVEVNPAFLRVTGLAESEVVGRLVADVVPPASVPLVLRSYLTAIAERRTVTWEEISEYPSGRKYGDVTVTPVFDAGGRCTHLVGTVHDTTMHKVAATRLAEQAALLDKAHDAIVVVGLDDSVRFWNAGAARLFGIASEEATGRRFSSLVGAAEGAFEHLRAKLERVGESVDELRRTTRSGELRFVESSATLLRDDAGSPHAVLVIETDITERKALASQLQRAQRLESLGTLASGIAHDFNNILTAILAHADIATSSLPTDHPAARAVAEIERASSRAAELTRRMLTFSREHESTRIPTDLREPIREALDLVRASMPARIAIGVALDDDVPLVVANTTEIHQIVMNLCTNAAHAIGERPGHIEVGLAVVALEHPRVVSTGFVAPGRHVVLTVRDDGEGMDAATIERVFEPYFTTKSAHGTGLGLSVVHGIVASHEGAIEIETERGRGTTFRIFFPAPGAERA